MLIPLETKTTELEVKKSRFITTAFPVTSFIELKEIITKTRQDNPGARHVVHSAVIGEENSLQYSMSDDREPKNTAGRPSLEVLKGSGITNVGIVIVRYFGGTLIGTNGLMHAYSDSTKLVLQTLKTKELIEMTSLSFKLPYELYDQAKRLLTKYAAFTTKEEFGTNISITLDLPKKYENNLKDDLTQLSSGKLTF